MALITDYKKQSEVVICSNVSRLGAVHPRHAPPPPTTLLWGGQHSTLVSLYYLGAVRGGGGDNIFDVAAKMSNKVRARPV